VDCKRDIELSIFRCATAQRSLMTAEMLPEEMAKWSSDFGNARQ